MPQSVNYLFTTLVKKRDDFLIANKGIKLFSSLVLSALWGGYYHYKYNVEAFNVYSINIWAFFLWLVFGYLFLIIYSFVWEKINRVYLRLTVSWVIYFVGLLIVEYIGYHVVCIRENSERAGNALIFGLIHGTLVLHIYYMLFPFLIIAVYHLLLRLLILSVANRR